VLVKLFTRHRTLLRLLSCINFRITGQDDCEIFVYPESRGSFIEFLGPGSFLRGKLN